MVFSEPAEALTPHPRDYGSVEDRVAYAALEGLDTWIETVRSWIEVLTHQDLDHRYPRYDAEFKGDGLRRWGGNFWLTKELPTSRTRTITPVSLARWIDILRRASRDEEPPLEHLLLRDARASLARTDYRRAAIDAGTAAELALNLLYRESLQLLSSSDQLSQDERNLGSLQRLFDRVPITYGVSSGALSDLIFARNKAAHEALEMSGEELARILETADELVKADGSDVGV